MYQTQKRKDSVTPIMICNIVYGHTVMGFGFVYRGILFVHSLSVLLCFASNLPYIVTFLLELLKHVEIRENKKGMHKNGDQTTTI